MSLIAFTKRLKTSQQGSVYLIVALCLSSFLILSAIVIDLTMAYSSQEQMRHTCEYASAAAAKAYMQTDVAALGTPASQYNARINNALTHANAIVSQNKMISIVANPTPFQPLTLNTTGTSSGTSSELIPGQWFSGPDAVTQCGADPCFLANNASTPGFEFAADAFRCELKTSGPIKTLLGKFFNQKDLNVSATATAKFKPLEMMFLVDLSQSITYGTHWPLVPGDPGFPTGLENNATCATAPQRASDYVLPIKGGSYTTTELNQFKYAFELLPISRSTASSPFVHYRDDFALLYYGNGDPMTFCSPKFPDGVNTSSINWAVFKKPPNALTSEVCYLVDNYRLPAGTCPYKGPEPLTSVFSSINQATNIISNRSIKADKTGFIAFDHRVLAPQPYAPPPAAPPIRSIELTAPANITSVANPVDKNSQFASYLITQPLSKTDIALSLKNAMDELDTTARATKSVILFSDGLSNCAYTGTNNGVTDNNTYNSFALSGSRSCAEVTATNWKDTFRDAYNTLMSIADIYASRGIKIYTIATGPWIMPGSYNYQRPEYTSCCSAAGAACATVCAKIDQWMNFDEIKNLSDPTKPFTQFPSAHPRYNDPRASGYQGPMQMLYKLAEKTGGKFYAIRPLGPSGCYDSRGIATCSNLTGSPRNNGSLQTIDTNNRDLTKQVSDYVREIIREEGLLLVEEG